MKRLFTALSLLAFAALPAFAFEQQPEPANRSPRTVIAVSDVIRMAQAGVSDEAVIEYVRNLREPFDVNADDMIAMTEAHVSPAVVKAVVDQAGVWKDRQPVREAPRERTTRSVYVTAPYAYDPWWYSPYGYGYGYGYDPFFYGPRFSFGVGFGFSRGYGFGHRFGGFHGRHH